MTTVRMMYRDEETRRRPGIGARPSNDVLMRTYETTSLVVLRPLVGDFHHWCASGFVRYPLDAHAASPAFERGSSEPSFAGSRLTDILRSLISMRPARWNSLISLETASLVEKIMFARS